jgi:hypothetical protein
MPVTILPNVKKKQLLFVTLDFQPCKRHNNQRELLIEWSNLVATGIVFLKAILKIK